MDTLPQLVDWITPEGRHCCWLILLDEWLRDSADHRAPILTCWDSKGQLYVTPPGPLSRFARTLAN